MNGPVFGPANSSTLIGLPLSLLSFSETGRQVLLLEDALGDEQDVERGRQKCQRYDCRVSLDGRSSAEVGPQSIGKVWIFGMPTTKSR